MKIKHFEEIEAWKLARELCRTVKILTARDCFSTDWELRKQLRNSSGSIMDCIAEGFERGNNNEFKYFLGIAKGSCGEVRSQAYRALDYEYISESERLHVEQLAKRISAALQGFIGYLNTSDFKGIRQLKPTPTDPNFPSQAPPNS